MGAQVSQNRKKRKWVWSSAYSGVKATTIGEMGMCGKSPRICHCAYSTISFDSISYTAHRDFFPVLFFRLSIVEYEWQNI